MLLPHGFEGQGPEHSSARLERYLQLCAEDNMQVCYCSTPSNYFHVLRRQLVRDFRKPLILMTPKSLLRHKRCISTLEEFAGETSFHRVLWDEAQLEGGLAADNAIKRVVLCTGKVYYDLEEERNNRGIKDVYLMRIEQLYPFPDVALIDELKRFPNADVVWCQEEPKNMGSWSFIRDPLAETMEQLGRGGEAVRYTGRTTAASPATGSFKTHVREQAALVDDAINIKKTVSSRKAPARKATASKPAAAKRPAKKK